MARKTASIADPLIELGELMRSEVMTSHGFREEIRQMIKDLLNDLPPDSRKFAGSNEAEFENFVDDLMVQSGDEILPASKLPQERHCDAAAQA